MLFSPLLLLGHSPCSLTGHMMTVWLDNMPTYTINWDLSKEVMITGNNYDASCLPCGALHVINPGGWLLPFSLSESTVDVVWPWWQLGCIVAQRTAAWRQGS